MRQCHDSRMASGFIFKAFGWMSFAATVLLFLLYLSSGRVYAASVQSLDALTKQFDSSACQGCHAKVHEEWSKSFHGRSILQSLGSLRTYVDALEKERKLPTNKTQMLKCLDCHAPMVNEASESVIQEIVRLIKSAIDDKSEAQKKSAREKLSSLSVNCLGCHSTKGTGDPLTSAAAGVIYGSKGAAAPHPVQVTPVMQSSVFCSQCHALWYAKDGEFLYCTTIFESHQNAYKGMGGTQSCQDCHMKNRGHTFPGAHDQSLVKEGLTLAMEAVGYQHLIANKYAPRAIVTVDVGNHAGHRIPDG
jgi:Cytochrome c554 and c-prime